MESKQFMRTLFEFLSLIHKHSSDNKMPAIKLAIIFAPLVIPSESKTGTVPSLTQTAQTQEAIRFLIEDTKYFFPTQRSKYLLKPIYCKNIISILKLKQIIQPK